MSFMTSQYPSNQPHGPSMYGVKSLSVVKLIVQTAGTYGDQYRRPMHSHADGAIMNMVEETMDRTNNLDALALAVPAFSLLKPDATPECMMPIENGWNTKRFRFLLHLLIEDQMGIMMNHYYTGFTGYSDMSHGGAIDPNMVFTINSANSTKSVTQRTPTGVHVFQASVSNNQILTSNNTYTGLASPNKTYSLRPESVVDDMLVSDLRSMSGTFENTVAVISTPQLSARANNCAPGYMSQLLSGFKNTVVGGADESTDSNLEHLKTLVSSDAYSSDKFLAWLLHRRTSNPTLGIGTHQFTINELMMLDSAVMTKLRAADAAGIASNFHQAGTTSDWGQSTAEVQFASMLAQALPSYMASMHLSVLAFTSMNLTLDGKIQTIITNAQSFNQQADITVYLQALIQRLNSEMFTALSYGNTMPFSVDVKCDTLGETWVSVSLNQGRMETFVTPTFCDSLFAPMTSGHQSTLQGLSNDFSQLFDLVEHKTQFKATGAGDTLFSQGGFKQAAPTYGLQVPPTTPPAFLNAFNAQPFPTNPVGFLTNNNPGF